MAQLFTMPQLGSTMEEGRVVLWNRKEGDAISRGDTLLEVETDKMIVEIAAPCDGIIHKILALPEMRIPIHQPIAILGQENDDIRRLLVELGLSGGNGEQFKTVKSANAPIYVGAQPDPLPFRRDTAIAISPRARRLADENRVPLTELAARGTGPEGRIIERDVLAYLEETNNLEGTDDLVGTSSAGVEPAAPFQQAILNNLVRPSTVSGDTGPIEDVNALALGLPGSRVRPELLSPATNGPLPTSRAVDLTREHVSAATGTLTMSLRVEMTACTELRRQLTAEVTRVHGAPLIYTAIVVKAMAHALSEQLPLDAAVAAFPELASIDIGGAALREGELLRFVVPGAAAKAVGAISAIIDQWTAGTQSGSGRNDELIGNTYRIIDLSESGIESFDPPFVDGNAAVLGMGHIAAHAVVVKQQMMVRDTMDVCLAYSSHILDTAFAVRLLHRIKELLEAPVVLLVS